MSDALFSDVLIVDRGPSASPATRTRQEAFATVLAEVMGKALPADAFPGYGSAVELSTLAAAVADIIAGRSVVLRLNADTADYRLPAVRTFLETVVRVTGTLEASRQEAAIAKLADVILPDDLADARGALAVDNLRVRDRFVDKTAPLTSAEVAAQAGHRSTNPYATAARWKKAGDIFSVHHRGTEYFPAFQFRDGRPHPTVRKALAALPKTLSAWQRALWFVSSNGWLGDRAPQDMLDDSDAVIAAARHEAEEVVG
jgi:hypothetical protein